MTKEQSYGNYPDLTTVKRILVIKLRHLGDVLLTTPLFSALKDRLPDAQIDAYIYKEAAPMLEGHPAISSLLLYDTKKKKGSLWQRLVYEASLLRQIRRKNYDLVLNLTEGDRGTMAAYFSGALIKVGFVPKGRWQKRVYTHLVKHCPGLRHTVERNLDVIRRIGIFPALDERELFFSIEDAEKKFLGPTPFILIHPTSRWLFKCLPVPKMRELVTQLLQRGKQVVITSGPDPQEQEMARAIGEGFPVQILAGQISLKQLGALIASSERLICVDSVPFHMASALKKPVIAFFGPTSDVTWGPWRNPHAHVLTQNLPCRPCYQDGCGGSKYSDCLATLDIKRALAIIDGNPRPNSFCAHPDAQVAPAPSLQPKPAPLA